MATNRYTQLTPASFNPLSIEETMMVPLAKQQRHDQTQLMAMQEGMFNNPFLDVDRELVEQGANEIKQGLAGIEEELATKGVSRGIVRKMLDLRRKKAEFLSPSGIGGKAAANYAGYQQNIKDIQTTMKDNPRNMTLAMIHARKRYADSGGVAEGQTYSPYMGFKTPNLSEIALDAGAKMKPFIEKNTQWRKDGDYWVKGTTKTTQLPKELIMGFLGQYMQTNPEVMDYIRERATVDPQFDPRTELLGILDAASNLFIRDDIEQDQSRQAIPQHLRQGQGNGNNAFRINTLNPGDNNNEGTALQTNILRGENYTNRVALGAPEGGAFGMRYVEEGYFNDGKTSNKLEGPRPKNYDITKHASTQQLKLWKKFGEQQIPDFNINNQAHQEQLADIIDAKSALGTGSITYTTLDPTVENFGNLLESQKSAAVSATVNAVEKRKSDGFFIDPQNPSQVITYQDLLKKYGTKDSQGRLDIEIVNAEAVSADNTFPFMLGKGYEQYSEDFRAPIQIQFKTPEGIKKVIMSRPLGDLSQHSKHGRIANRDVSEVVGKPKMIPGLKTEAILYDFNNRQPFPAMVSYDPEKGYLVEELNSQGQITDSYYKLGEDLMQNIYEKWEYGTSEQ